MDIHVVITMVQETNKDHLGSPYRGVNIYRCSWLLKQCNSYNLRLSFNIMHMIDTYIELFVKVFLIFFLKTGVAGTVYTLKIFNYTWVSSRRKCQAATYQYLIYVKKIHTQKMVGFLRRKE